MMNKNQFDKLRLDLPGAHLFPYAWSYKAILYAIFAGIITVGSLLPALLMPIDEMYVVPVLHLHH